ncbi:membrane-binding protein [Pontibacter sp. 172403-2]|uniref:membrane-binding protein n=1 Tax=Pontibacter rufus TaxID=2791028 RepID=UPI0018AFA5CB|nr:membrane-binding protein [Pontibacter sp. 172403-2]MBF9254168.1 membrane-binding protein [Pontibacter sp. 172403-2]
MQYLKKITFILGLLLAPVLTQAAVQPAAAPATTTVATTGARDIVQEIINVIGLKPRFELRPADIDNAAAVIYNGQRYILYNEDFLAAINNAVHTDWAGVSILAHEIGHHLNGHTLKGGGSNVADELEADEFSGFVLRKLGANLADAQAAINLLSEEGNSSTHPGKSYRLAAISKGWRKANDQLLASAKSPQPDSRAIVSRPAQRAPRQTVQRVSLDSRQVLTRVNFNAAPDEQFYLTKSMQLVHLTEEGVQVIGALNETGDSDYPYYFETEYQPLFITADGVVVNRQGERVGYFS